MAAPQRMQCTAVVDLHAAQARGACPMQRVRQIVERRCECLSSCALCGLSALRHDCLGDMYACVEAKRFATQFLIVLSGVRQVPWRMALPQYQRAQCRQHVEHLVVMMVCLAVLVCLAVSLCNAFVFYCHSMRPAQGV